MMDTQTQTVVMGLAGTELKIQARGDFVGIFGCLGTITVKTDQGAEVRLRNQHAWKCPDPYRCLLISSTWPLDIVEINYGFGFILNLPAVPGGAPGSPSLGGMLNPPGVVVPFRTTRNNLNLSTAPMYEVRTYDFAPGPAFSINNDDTDVSYFAFDVTDTDPLNPWTGVIQIVTTIIAAAPAELFDTNMKPIGDTIPANGRYYMRGKGIRILHVGHVGGANSAKVATIWCHSAWPGDFEPYHNNWDIQLDPVTGIQVINVRIPINSLFLELGGAFAGGETLTLEGSAVTGGPYYFLSVYVAIGQFTAANLRQFTEFRLTSSAPPSGITGNIEAVR